MGFFIDPSLLPGGRGWAAACDAAANGTAAASALAGVVDERLECDAGGFGGLVQVLTLMAVYGLVLYQASGMIAGGSEMLLLVPSMRDIVGSVVLPVLGAIPDGCIVFFSGLGENAQEEISIGVGALAGSTAMLLTVPWFLSILAGRVNIRADGQLNYSRFRSGPWRKLDPDHTHPLTETGVEPRETIRKSGRIMLMTAGTYLVIQATAFSAGNFIKARQTEETTALAASLERIPALFCFFVAMAAFVSYLYVQITAPDAGAVEVRHAKTDDMIAKSLESGQLSLSTAAEGLWDTIEENAGEGSPLRVVSDATERLEKILRYFFKTYDKDNSNSIDKYELRFLLRDLGEYPGPEEFDQLHQKMSNGESGHIDFKDFALGIEEYLSGEHFKRTFRPKTPPGSSAGELSGTEEMSVGPEESGGLDDEHEMEIPADLAHLDADAQIRKIKIRAFTKMAIGTLLVLIFSDPMVDVLGDVGARIGVSPFYISFILAPLASNASELFAAYQYAKKKTRKSVTISMATLLGASILNNTFVLAIFMALIVVKGLAWNFTAETIAIIFVEASMFFFTQKRVQTLKDGYYILALFPASLALVAILENVIGLD